MRDEASGGMSSKTSAHERIVNSASPRRMGSVVDNIKS